MTAVHGPLSWTGRVLAWLVILAALTAIGAAVVVPRLAGATPYTVQTGSMRPSLPPGTLVVVEPVEFEELSVGDVITYQVESGRQAVATHRIVGLEANLAGENRIRTKGDANEVADPETILPVQVRGRQWYAVPHLGQVNDVITGAQRTVLLYAAVTGLLGYAAFMFVGAARDRRRQGQQPPAGAGADRAVVREEDVA